MGQNSLYDNVVIALLIANVIFTCVSVEYNAQNPNDPMHWSFRVVSVILCFCFMLELLLRMAAAGKDFFFENRAWNLFDTILVLFQVLEEIFTVVSEPIWATDPQNASSLHTSVRILHLLRVLRIFRMLRLVSSITELGKI